MFDTYINLSFSSVINLITFFNKISFPSTTDFALWLVLYKQFLWIPVVYWLAQKCFNWCCVYSDAKYVCQLFFPNPLWQHSGQRAAIKKMDMQATREFLAELKVLTHVHHLNLVIPVPFSRDGVFCIRCLSIILVVIIYGNSISWLIVHIFMKSLISKRGIKAVCFIQLVW